MAKISEDIDEIILEKSMELLKEKGYHNFNMRDVASVSGIATGTVYNYYKTKNDLLFALIRFYWKDYGIKLETILKSNMDIYAKLKKIYNMIEAYVNIFKDFWLVFDEEMLKRKPKDKSKIFSAVLASKIEEQLKEIIQNQPEKYKEVMDLTELSKFIVANMMNIAQIKFVDYSTFETVLKNLIEK